MRSPVHIFALTLGLLVWSVAPAWGQVDDAPRLDAIWEAYQQFEYEAARELARAALDAYEDPEDLAEVLVILGLISFSENRELEAELQFREALRLNRNVNLDPLLVSPKILDFFEEVKAEMAETGSEESLDPGVVPRYVLVPDRRSEAVPRSMVLPGWASSTKASAPKASCCWGSGGLRQPAASPPTSCASRPKIPIWRPELRRRPWIATTPSTGGISCAMLCSWAPPASGSSATSTPCSSTTGLANAATCSSLPPSPIDRCTSTYGYSSSAHGLQQGAHGLRRIPSEHRFSLSV